ncbi:MAG: hypothetical protein AB7V77_04570 [Candidatus Woesearchaeota archaeon]
MNYEHYLGIFSLVMKKRYIYLSSAFKQKEEIDTKITDLNSENKSKLLELMGKDHFFKKAENINQQSIRHFLYKINTSMKYIDSKGSNILKEIHDLNANIETKQLMYSILKLANKKKITFERLEKNIEQQARYLEDKETTIIQYKKIVEYQNFLIKELNNYNGFEEQILEKVEAENKELLNKLQIKANNQTKSIVNETKNEEYNINDLKISILWILSAIILYTTALSISNSEESSHILNRILTVGGTLSLWGALLTASIKKVKRFKSVKSLFEYLTSFIHYEE